MMRELVSKPELSRRMRRAKSAVHETIESGRVADASVPTEDGREKFDYTRVYAILADDYPDMPLPK